MGGVTASGRLSDSAAAATAFTATLTVAAVLTAVGASAIRTAGLAAVVGVIVLISWWSRWSGALISAGLAALVLDGFVTDRFGVLHWHGEHDLLRLALLGGCALVSSHLHSALRPMRRHRTAWTLAVHRRYPRPTAVHAGRAARRA